MDKEKIAILPNSPGVYLMKDEKGKVLYVGKAEDLRKRVSSYFRKSRRLPDRIESLVLQIRDISYIPTATSAEALIYENGLIKQLEPKYNVALRDDKSYPLLKLTLNEKFPRLFITRRKIDDGAVYFGPYTNVKLLREALGIVRRIFALRTCVKMPRKACLNLHIKQCLGPCIGKVSEPAYKDIVLELKLFLEGKKEELLRLLSEKMTAASTSEDYEEASRLRDKILALSVIREKAINYSPLEELEELKNILGMAKPPERIEAFDVSNIMGEAAVGSMIYFYKGHPKKDEYRKFRIKTVNKIDDYGMIRELINRRYKRLVGEGKSLPDLVLIDGGRGHLNVVLEELRNIGLSHIPAISIAKEFEHIYLKDRKDPIILPKESKVLHLLERMRDEAHRFAISYHKAILSKKISISELDNIKGIGIKRKKALISHFGSVDRIKNVSDAKELLKVKGLDKRSARNIIEYFSAEGGFAHGEKK